MSARAAEGWTEEDEYFDPIPLRKDMELVIKKYVRAVHNFDKARLALIRAKAEYKDFQEWQQILIKNREEHDRLC